jgi:hypothetical protein
MEVTEVPSEFWRDAILAVFKERDAPIKTVRDTYARVRHAEIYVNQLLAVDDKRQ